jgi:ubiquinone/menaquinone biosynthesis C-methylase UbiE
MSQQYFDQVAGEWDSLQASMFGDAVREAAIERAGLHPEAVVVDLGAGAGFLSQGLAPQVARLHVIDQSPEMLAVARQNLAGYGNIEYHLADGASIPLPDRSVDAVLANMYLHHMPEPGAAIREMARVLHPGGRLVITDLDAHSYAWLREEHHDVWLGFSREAVRAWLEEAGLVNALVEDTRQTCQSQSQVDGAAATVGIFVAAASQPQPGMVKAVQQHYRQIAAGGSSCCGPAEPRLSPLESEQSGLDTIALPVLQDQASCCSPGAGDSCCGPEAAVETDAEISLGCGNPVALASLQPGEFVLDIGSGAGADVFPAAQRVGERGRVIGLDMLPEMLARAQNTARTHGYTNVEFRQGDAQSIPLEDASVNVVMSNCVINLVQDKGLVFRESFRVLKPGGRLSISDIVTDRAFSAAARQDAESWSACVSGALPEREYVGLISQAGFTRLSFSRSQAWEAGDGTRVYSLNIQAFKPA